MKKQDRPASGSRARVGIKIETRRSLSDQTAPEAQPLTPEEEKVIRMLHGLSEPDACALEFAVGASQEATLRLALMETNNIVALDGAVPRSSADPTQVEAALERIVARWTQA